ncbi:hypothetical protein [Tenacibaculum sp. SG-28]|uniref:hypothetical protein n=1 Tax=Tenacibaculum sp. SG-28 TaxID=754426 RepID=UPI0011B00CB5|nr:hypothetical protein [Tenacibaculum sp. SG-28]
MKHHTQRELLAVTKEKNKVLMAYLQNCNTYFEVPQILTVKLINTCADLELLHELHTFFNSNNSKEKNQLVTNFLHHSEVYAEAFKDTTEYEFVLRGLLQEFYLKIVENLKFTS